MNLNRTLCEVLKGLADDIGKDAREARYQAQQMRAKGMADQIIHYSLIAATHEKDEKRLREAIARWNQ